MTTKELLYVEDALGHAQYFKQQCSQIMGQIQDPELKRCVESMTEKHTEIFQNFYGLL